MIVKNFKAQWWTFKLASLHSSNAIQIKRQQFWNTTHQPSITKTVHFNHPSRSAEWINTSGVADRKLRRFPLANKTFSFFLIHFIVCTLLCPIKMITRHLYREKQCIIGWARGVFPSVFIVLAAWRVLHRVDFRHTPPKHPGGHLQTRAKFTRNPFKTINCFLPFFMVFLFIIVIKLYRFAYLFSGNIGCLTWREMLVDCSIHGFGSKTVSETNIHLYE